MASRLCQRVVATLLFGLTWPALAQVAVDQAWVRATVPGQTATGAFMQWKAARPARFVKAQTPLAESVELHHMQHVDGQMRMRALPTLAVKPGAALALQPGAEYHLMLLGLKRPAQAGEAVLLTLEFEGEDRKRFVVDVPAKVQPLNYVPFR